MNTPEYKFKKQYIIERDIFSKIFDEFFPSFDIFDDIINSISDEFIVLNYNETIHIHNLSTLQSVTWYKYAHIGRCLETIGIENEEDIRNFFIDFVEDYKESRVYDIILKSR